MYLQYILIVGVPVVGLIFSILWVIDERDWFAVILAVLLNFAGLMVGFFLASIICGSCGVGLQNTFNVETYKTETVQLATIDGEHSLMLSWDNDDGQENYHYGTPVNAGVEVHHLHGEPNVSIYPAEENDCLVIDHCRYKNPIARFLFIAPDRYTFYVNGGTESVGGVIAAENFED